MTLNFKTEYALRVIIYLLTRPEEIVPTRKIAERYGISLNHLSKISQKLVQLDIVSSTRGVGGGVMINESALSVGLGDLMQAIEPATEVVACNGSANIKPCPILSVCSARNILAGAQQAFWDHLNQYKIGDLVKNKQFGLLKKVLNKQECD